MNKHVVLLGSGGHARVLMDILKHLDYKVAAVFSPDKTLSSSIFANIKHFLDDEDVLLFDKEKFSLVNGLGSLPGGSLRSDLFQKFTGLGYRFETILSPYAIISSHAIVNQGAQILHGTIIQSGAEIGCNTIVNTGAIIEHNCLIGSSNHIAPGVTLSGHVETGNNVHIGTGASVIQSIRIGKNTVVGAGVTLTEDVPVCSTVRGCSPKIERHQ